MNTPHEALTSRRISTIVLGFIFIWTVVLLVLPVWNYYQSHRAPLAVAQQSAFYIICGNVGIWSIGMLGLYLGKKRLQKHILAHILMEKMLHDSEERHRFLADNTTNVIWSMDFDGRHTYLSPSIEKLRGYTPAEVMQQTMEEIHTPESFVIISQAMTKAILNIQAGLPVEDFREELEARCKDGSTVWTEVTGSASYNSKDEFMEFIGVTRDITSRKQMEDALRKSESRFRSFVENANDIIFMMDTNGVFTYISPNWETMIGRNHTSFIGETFEPLVHPDDIPACHAFLKRIITTREKAENLEYRVRHNDGNWLWHSSNGASIFDSAGELIGGIGIARDITNRKQVETYREMGRQVLQIINDIGDLCESILGILKILKTQTGADAVGIRLKDGDDFPYFAQEGLSGNFR